jgi:hypothetical protein
MKVNILWTDDAAAAQGRETTWSGIEWVESHPDELILHKQEGEHPVTVDRSYVIAYNQIE